MEYRKEVDGLRALAVIPVIFFHAGFSLLSGGFVGVDIFFVISGYLITYLLLEEHSKGNFSLLRFYERRVRRILPALFFMLACTLPAAWYWLLPSQFKEFSQSIAAVVLFCSNVFFYFKTGYFASAVDEKALIHTWSLAVEEQFYIVFPLLLMLVWRLCRDKLAGILIAIAIVSYIAAEVLSRSYPSLSFYAMPTRAWELLAGSLCAIFLFKRQRLPSHTPLALAGLLLMLLSFFVLHKSLPWPSFYTLLPVIGACLVILFAHNTPVARVLSTPMLVGLGLVSYSAYLWHQPLLAFARVGFLGGAPQWLLYLLAAAAFPIAALSWKYIEQPFRKKRDKAFVLPVMALAAMVIVSAGGLMLFAAAGHIKQGFQHRFALPESVANTIARSTNAYQCFDLPYPHREQRWGCDIGDQSEDKPYDFLVWGDSHLLVSYNAFVAAARNKQARGFYVGIRQCTPFLGIHALRYDQQERNCHQLNQRVFEFVKAQKIPKIILVSRWSYYASGGYEGDNYSFIGLAADDKKTPENSQRAFDQGLKQTLEAYQAIGVEVVLMEQVPQQKLHPEEIYYRAYAQSDIEAALTKLSVTKQAHLAMQSAVMTRFDQQAEIYPHLRVLRVSDAFCDERCLVGDASASLYFDEDHLSIEGSKKLEPILEEVL